MLTSWKTAELTQQRRDGGFGFFAEVASGTGIERHIARAASGEPRFFGRVASGHISRSGLGIGILPERAGIRVKSMSAIELFDLAQMPEVVAGPFVEHVGQRNSPELGMDASARARRGRELCQHYKGGSASAGEVRQIFSAGTVGILLASLGAIQIVFRKGGRILGHDAPHAPSVNLLKGGEMGQHFGDGPAGWVRFPLQKLCWQITKQRFEKLRRLS